MRRMGRNRSKLNAVLKNTAKGDYEQVVSFRISTELLQEIDKIAEKGKTTRTKVLISAIKIGIDFQEGGEK